MTDSFSSVFDALLGALSVAPGFREGDLFYVALLNKRTLQIEFPLVARKEGNNLVRIQDEARWKAHPFSPQTLLPDCILQDGKPVLISDQSLANAVTDEKLTFSEPPTHACWLGVPLESRGEVLGALIADHQPQATVHNERIQDLLFAIAGRISNQIARARLVRNLRMPHEVGRVLTSASHRLTEQEVVDLIVEQTGYFLNADSMYVALYDDERRRLTFPAAVEGGESEVFEPRTVNLEDQASGGLTEVVIRTRQSLCPRNVEEEYKRRNLVVRIPPLPKSWLGVPMLLEDRVLGVISLRNDAIPHLYSEDDRDVLQAMAGQAAIAIDNARLFYDVNWRLAEANKRLEVLIEIGQALGSGIQLPLNDILQLIHQQAERLMDTSNMYVALYDQETYTLSFPLAVYRGQRQTDWPSRRADIRDESRGGLTEIVLRTGKSLRPDDVEAEYRARNLEVPVPPIPKSWLGVPMRSGNKILGVIALQDDETEGAYTAEAQAVLEVMAAQAALAIENARLLHQAEWARQLAGLQRIAVDISSELKLDALLTSITDSVNLVTSADFSTLFVYNSETEAFEIGVRRGKIKKVPDLPSQSGLAGTIAKERLSRFIVDAHLDTLVKATVLDEKKVQSFAAVPLVCKGKTVGILFVNFWNRHEFSLSERNLLDLLANQAAVAIENARLYERNRWSTKLEKLYETALSISSELDLSHVLRSVVEGLFALLEPDVATVLSYDLDKREFIDGVQIVDGVLKAVKQPSDKGFAGQLVENGIPVFDSLTLNDTANKPTTRGGHQIQARAGIPLKVGEACVGAMLIEYYRDHAFSAEEEKLAYLFGLQAANAINNARQIQKIQEFERQEKWYKVGQIATLFAHRIGGDTGLIRIEVEKLANQLNQVGESDEALRKSLNTIRQANLNIQELTETLSTPVKAANEILAPTRVNLLVKEALKRANPPSDVQIALDLAEPSPKARVNRYLIQVILELVSNAIEAMRDCSRKELMLQTCADSDWTKISVSDTGRGIATEDKEKIFELLYSKHADERESRHFGFGLWWVRTFLQDIGGNIVVVSEPGQGATFTVKLPREV